MKNKIAANSYSNILEIEAINYSCVQVKVLTERRGVLVGFEDSLISEEENI